MAVSGLGTIHVQFNKSSYAPGEQVNGYIYLNLFENHPSNTVYLKICGVEEVKLVEERWVTRDEYYRHYRYWGKDFQYWGHSRYNKRRLTTRWDYWDSIPSHHHRRTEGETERRRILIDHYGFNPVFNHKFPVYQFNSPFIPAGQYSFPISFVLPKGMPATFNYEFTEYGIDCFADTSYTCIASVDSSDFRFPSVKSTRHFCVNQAIKSGGQMRKSNIDHTVNCCCCIGKGRVKICSYFERSDYTPGETAYIVAEVDNSDCKVKVDHINGTFRQNLRLTAGKYTKNIRKALNKVKLQGIDAGEKKVGDKSCRLAVRLVDNSSGNEVQPTCEGNLIHNNYVLETTTKMDTCICCGSHPTASIPANIFNRAFEDSGWSQPSNWQPQVMSAYVANFNSDFKFNATVGMNSAMNMGGNQGAQMGQPGMPQIGGQGPVGQGQIGVNMHAGGQGPVGGSGGFQPLGNGGQDYPDE